MKAQNSSNTDNFDPRIAGGLHTSLLTARNDTQRKSWAAELHAYLYGLDGETAGTLAGIWMEAFESRTRAEEKNIPAEDANQYWKDAEASWTSYYQELAKTLIPQGFEFAPEELARIEIEGWKLDWQGEFTLLQEKLAEKYKKLYGLTDSIASEMSRWERRSLYYYRRYKNGEDAWIRIQSCLTSAYEYLRMGRAAL